MELSKGYGICSEKSELLFFPFLQPSMCRVRFKVVVEHGLDLWWVGLGKRKKVV